MAEKVKFSRDGRYVLRPGEKGKLRYQLKGKKMSEAERNGISAATFGLGETGAVVNNKVVGWERLSGEQIDMLPLTPMQRSVREAIKVSREGTLEELSRSVADIRSFHDRTVKHLEGKGEKPDRHLKKLGKEIGVLQKKLDKAMGGARASRDHGDLPFSGSVTDRKLIQEKCDGMFKHAAQVGVLIGHAHPRNSFDGGVVNADGVRLPSPQSYENAAAILGRGFDAAATEMEMRAYKDAGKEPPAALRDHSEKIRSQRHPYENF